MTVIAWDGHTLAGDRQRTHGGTPVAATKVFKIQAPDGRLFLVGAAGRADCTQMFVAWLRGGEKPLMPSNVDDFGALVVDVKRRVWNIHDTLFYVHCSAKQWAIGSGANYALGAMAAGATAAQAVRIASKLDVHCGLGVDCVTF